MKAEKTDHHVLHRWHHQCAARLYVLIEGTSFLPSDTARILALVFLAFAAVDFYFRMR